MVQGTVLMRSGTSIRPERRAATPLFALFLGLALVSCDQSFDPRAQLDNELVVFSLLSTDRNAQFVRVESTYMPPEYNPLSYSADNFLSDAIVSIKAPNGVFQLRDTLLPRADTSRYKFPLQAYVLSSFVPQRGKSYQVLVQSPTRGQVTSTVIIPDRTTIDLSAETFDVLAHPDQYTPDAPIVYTIRLSQNAKAFVGRLLLCFDVLKGSEWVEEQAEIPVVSSDSSSYSLDVPRYPRFAVTPSTSQIGLLYRNGYYKAIINKLNDKYHSTKVIFKWTTLRLLQADQHLYEYFTVTHGSEDPYSIRLDQPMVSSISGGFGMVGAYSVDSLVNILPERFWGDR
jgi:hypothetical protein